MAPRCAGRSTEPDLHQHRRRRGEGNHCRSARSGQAPFSKSRYRAPRNSELLVLPEALFLVARGHTKHCNTKCVRRAGEIMSPDLGGARTNELRKVLAARVGQLNHKLCARLGRRRGERHRGVAAE